MTNIAVAPGGHYEVVAMVQAAIYRLVQKNIQTVCLVHISMTTQRGVIFFLSILVFILLEVKIYELLGARPLE